MTTLRDVLANDKVLARVIVPAEIDALLGSLTLLAAVPDFIPQPWTDTVQGGVNQSLLGFASVNIDPIGPKAQFTLTPVEFEERWRGVHR